MRSLAVVSLIAGIVASGPASAMDMEFAREIMAEATGAKPDAKIPGQMVQDVLRGVMEQHAMQSLGTHDLVPMQVMHGKLIKKRFALADGDSAEIAYLDDVKPYVQTIPMPEAFYGEWVKRSPDSALPHLLFASTQLSLAAETRRAAIFVPTADRNAEMVAPRIEVARGYLLLNKTVAARSGYWYNLMVEIAILQETGGDEVKRLVREGLEAFPDNVQLAVLGSNYFLPKWYGDAKALEDYAVWVTGLPALSQRQDVYAQIYGNALRNDYGLKLFTFAAKNWDRMRPSLKALIRNYPGERNSSAAGVLACLGGDRRLTREALSDQRVGMSVEYWMDPDAYGLCVNWAAGG